MTVHCRFRGRSARARSDAPDGPLSDTAHDYIAAMLVSERIGQFFLEQPVRDRLEYTEYGGGDAWVVLLHGQLMPRRMHQPLARALAAEGLHVVTLDLLGHGRSDRPADPHAYSMTAFAEQVVALLDHLGAAQAVVGGTSLGANVSLEVAVLAPERVRGLIVEMPVLNNALEAGILAFAPLMFAARFLPFTVTGAAAADPAGAARRGAVLGRASCSTPATSGRTRWRPSCTGCSSAGSRRRPASGARIAVPALVVGHPARPDPPGRRRRDAGRGDAQRDLRAGPQHPRVAGHGRTG